MKILVLEPSLLQQHLLTKICDATASQVTCVKSGFEGLKKLKPHSFDLILTSYQLVDMDCLEFSKLVHKKDLIKNCPIILITTHTENDLQVKCLEAGITEIFKKSHYHHVETYITQYASKHLKQKHVEGRILYVEDMKLYATIIKEIFKETDFKIDHFETAEEGLKFFVNHDYDLVITDIVLKGSMTGMGLVREIRQLTGVKNRIPILAMSGHDDEARKIEMLSGGANDYVSKPVLKEEFLARVNNLVLNKKLLDKVEQQQRRLQEMAMTDQLTSLHNRHFLLDYANKLISESKRHEIDISLIIIDIDFFKTINDTHGHATGDLVLQAIGKLLRLSCRTEDCAARFGGEEFVLMLTHCRLKDAIVKAEKIRKAIENLRPAKLKITASFGVASLADGGELNFDTLFNQADQGVYLAKERGRNQVVNYLDTG